MQTLLQKSATELARLIKSKEVSSRDVVETHIQHIQKVNPKLNAIVKDNFAEARLKALEADQQVKTGLAQDIPFLGVPCSIKECFAMQGMPQTAGVVARRHLIAKSDATAVQRYKQAGAIPLGVTNISEICMWMESNNRLYGRTNNPYDQSRIVGGSSGGEGAIIGAGGVPFGLGSDIGGSVRMPAFFNGIFGHKPTGGLVPNTGQFPPGNLPNKATKIMRYLTTGPLARRAEDLMPLLQIMAGPDGHDRACFAMELGDPKLVNLKGLSVTSLPRNGRQCVARDLIHVQKSCLQKLAEQGARTQTQSVPLLKESFDIWSAMLEDGKEAGSDYKTYLGNGQPINPVLEFIKWGMGLSKHTFPALALALIEGFPKHMPKRTQKFVEFGIELRSQLLELMGPEGVLLFPSNSLVAPRHNRPLFSPFNWVYTAILNVMEFPVTQVPLGLNKKGLPLGVQVVGRPGQDHITIGVALELEKIFGGWVMPEGES